MVGMAISEVFLIYTLFNIQNPKKIIFSQFIYILIVQYLTNNEGASRIVLYLGDVNTLILFIQVLQHRKFNYLFDRKNRIVTFEILAFFIFALISVLVNQSSILLAVWATRNYMRFFTFFFACYTFLGQADVKKILKILYYLLIINFLLSVYQYSILGYKGDNLGGIFGTAAGCNAYSNILFVIMITYGFGMYMQRKISLIKIIIILFCCFACSIMAELKFFFYEFFIIVILNVVLRKPSLKTILIICISCTTFVLGTSYFNKYNNRFKEYQFYKISSLTTYATIGSYSYTSSSINRLTGLSIISQNYLTGILHKIFGVGFGNADYSSYFISPYYSLYWRTNYAWFLHTFLLLEVGWMGLSLYILIFVFIIISAMKQKNDNYKLISISTTIIAILSIILMWYNSSLRMDVAYILFGVLAFGFIKDGSNEYSKQLIKLGNQTEITE
ncbi:hypothetical protein [Clostridium oryzae]|uniref:O-antigen ligase n=1 Tax=Clostridium oryzae TaxID=1450648 RepID=A0A1V4IS04_9CLOT|nr:hypothetical protein [Clostridium oryzae]OPJ62706.1 hypothetical protein CLORY_15860 [Clostridium oryzae]